MRQFKPGQLQTGSLYNISSSYAVTASYALSAGIDTGSLVTTSSFNSFTASYTTGSFTGSFIGDGSQLTGIVSSKWTGSNPISRTGDVAITGSLYFPNNTHSIYFSGSNAASKLTWNNTDGTLDLGLKGGNVTLQIGQETVARVVNKSGTDLLESNFQIVRVRSVSEGGAQGQRLAVVLAQADSDADSATTLGVVTETITNNQEGFITVFGQVRGIDTTGAKSYSGSETWVDGDMLYLSPTHAGYLTNVKPQAPQHLVIIGYVEYAHQNNGKIFVKIDNGWELGELHDVRDTTTSSSYGDLLVKSGSVWTNSKQLTGSYGLTGSLTATSFTGSLLGTASYATSASYATVANSVNQLDQDVLISGSLTVIGNSVFYGSASFTYVTSSQLALSSSFISVNVFEPLERFGGLKVYDSGSSSATASLAWDSTNNRWVYQNASGSSYNGGMLLSGPRNTGSLGDEPTLTRWFVTRGDGGDHLNDTQIYSSGSTTIVTGSMSLLATTSGTSSVFNIRNSTDTRNIFKIQGDGNAYLGEETDGGQKSFFINAGNNPRLVLDTQYTTDSGVISLTRRYYGTIGVFNDNALLVSHNSFADGNNYAYKMHFVNPSTYYGAVAADGYNAGFMWFKNSAIVSNLQMKLSPDNALSIYTSSASPLESVITGSAFQIWASGSTGNAKPYIRTQNGTLLYLGDESRLFNVTASSITASFTGSLQGSASFATSASFALTASYIDIAALPLISPIGEYTTATSSILAGTTMTLPNGLTYVSSSIYEYISVAVNGLLLRYNLDFIPITTASIQFNITIPSGSEISYRSYRRP